MATAPASTFRDLIEQHIAALLADRQAAALTPQSRQMIERIAELVLRAGKRSRPTLLRLAYIGYGGRDEASLVDIGVALELQHQFLLVHDDIMDDDVIRYDGPNLLGRYRRDYPAEQSDIASSMALMAGNLLFTFACQALLEHPTLPDAKKLALLALLQETNIGVHAGQQLDIVNLAALKPGLDNEQLLRTAYLKTALYTVRQPLQAAAELLDLAAGERAKIDDFAANFGILYQLTDDYSDYFANDSSFESHPKFRDYRQGKLTFPLLAALDHTAGPDKTFLQANLGDKRASDETMSRVARILATSGAKVAAQQQIAGYLSQTRTALAGLAIEDTARQQFDGLLASLTI